MEEKDFLVSEFQKNARETVRVRLTTYQGRDLIDIRCFYKDPETGEMKPGKGIALRRELLPQLKEAISKAEDMASENADGE